MHISAVLHRLGPLLAVSQPPSAALPGMWVSGGRSSFSGDGSSAPPLVLGFRLGLSRRGGEPGLSEKKKTNGYLPREWSALPSSPTGAGAALPPVVLAAVLLRASPAKAVAVHRGSMAQFGAGLVAVLVGFESFFLEDNFNLVLCFDFLVLALAGSVVNRYLCCCALVFLTCLGAGLAVVSLSVVDFLLGFDLCRWKSHLLRGHRTEVGWIFPPPIFGFLNEPIVCSIGACNSSRCRKFAHNVLLPDLSVRFTST